MIILIDTSTSECCLTVIENDKKFTIKKQADRTLAKNLLSYLLEILSDQNKTWSDITAIGVYRGPGSFTGLRIGLTVANSIADGLDIPIVGGCGDDWQTEIIAKLNSGINEKIVLPFYGSEANITISRK